MQPLPALFLSLQSPSVLNASQVHTDLTDESQIWAWASRAGKESDFVHL